MSFDATMDNDKPVMAVSTSPDDIVLTVEHAPATGEEMYETWQSEMETAGCGVETPWEELSPYDVQAWNALAAGYIRK